MRARSRLRTRSGAAGPSGGSCLPRFTSRVLQGILAGAAIAGALVVSGCGSTSLLNMWKNPTYADGPLENVLVISDRRDSLRRRSWEDTFVAALAERGVSATPCYRIFPDSLPDEKAVREHVRHSRYDGVLLARKHRREERSRYVPGYTTTEPVAVRDPYWGAWTTTYRQVSTPGYVQSESTVQVETMVWDVKSAKLVWAGISETVDPLSGAQVSQEVSKVVVAELARAKIVR